MTNILPLYTFFEIMGAHPWHSFGIAGTGSLAINTGCNTLVRRYEWQNSDAAGMRSVELAIEQAEAKLREYLGFSPAPHYVTETLPWPLLADRTLMRTGPYGADGRWLNVKLTEGEVRAVGVETLAAISLTVAVVYTDTDGDGIDDTFTVSAATTQTDISQIAVYFSSGDRFNGWGATTDVSARWRLQPVIVTIAGGTVTVQGPKQLCVKPLKYEGVTNIGANGLDPATAANFVTTLDIYRRYTATDGNTITTSQAVITWETRPSHGWWCCCDGCAAASTAFGGSPYDPAAVAQAVARVGIRDGTQGLVTPAEAAFDSVTGIWSSLDWTVCDQPDRVTIRYLAGFPLASDGQMQEPWRTVVARYAAAELARPICGCDSASRELFRWQLDLARSSGNADEAYGAINPNDLDNPLGTRRGHVQAWRFIRQRRAYQGFLA
jgi:hypothetical protein